MGHLSAIRQDKEVKKAFGIGAVCIISYLMSYYMRNLLSVMTPQMLSTGTFTKEAVALLSSVYMAFYAGGQLVNGFIGDILEPKYMVLVGYSLGGLAMLSFPNVPMGIAQIVCFAVLGVGFSMLRGPLVKTISENTLPDHARLCCAFFSFSCHFGPTIASVLAMFFDWKSVFPLSGVVAFVTGIAAYLFLTIMEKKKYIVPRKVSSRNIKGTDVPKNHIFAVFFIPKFVMYMFIGMVVEIAASSITFWIPTYVNEYLMFSQDASNFIFSAISIITSICPFFSLLLFKKTGEDDVRIMRIMFSFSALFFLGMLLPLGKWMNILFLVLARIAMASASCILWSIYVPSLASSGKVSGANGVLDCSGYVGASVANMGFAAVMGNLGWNGLIVTWGAVALVGVFITLFVSKKKKRSRA